MKTASILRSALLFCTIGAVAAVVSTNFVVWDMLRGRIFSLSDIPVKDEPHIIQTWFATS